MVQKLVASLLFCITLLACKNDPKSFSFKEGKFKTYLESKTDSSYFYRTEKFQVETYQQKTDTFHITWKNKFEFHLKKQHPKTRLDSTKFIVKITKIKNNSYEFLGYYFGSNFKQKGSTFRLEDTP
jgi:thiol:disulfide interchange protein